MHKVQVRRLILSSLAIRRLGLFMPEIRRYQMSVLISPRLLLQRQAHDEAAPLHCHRTWSVRDYRAVFAMLLLFIHLSLCFLILPSPAPISLPTVPTATGFRLTVQLFPVAVQPASIFVCFRRGKHTTEAGATWYGTKSSQPNLANFMCRETGRLSTTKNALCASSIHPLNKIREFTNHC